MRLINADVAVVELEKHADILRRRGLSVEAQDMQGVANLLNNPGIFHTVDAVPVVRCRDCKHCAVCGNGIHVCKAYDLHLLRTTPDGYCFRGERRESSDE